MKTCFKCRKMLPLTEFYTHPRMGDGHLGKCKSCTRKDTADRVALKSTTDLEWVLKERERHRLKAAKQRESGKASGYDKVERSRKYKEKFPHKKLAHMIAGNAMKRGKLTKGPCEVCGELNVEAHHDDYDKPLEVRWLCKKHHMEHHIRERDAKIAASFVTKS